MAATVPRSSLILQMFSGPLGRGGIALELPDPLPGLFLGLCLALLSTDPGLVPSGVLCPHPDCVPDFLRLDSVPSGHHFGSKSQSRRTSLCTIFASTAHAHSKGLHLPSPTRSRIILAPGQLFIAQELSLKAQGCSSFLGMMLMLQLVKQA